MIGTDLMVDQQRFEVRVAIVFARFVMLVVFLEWREVLEPLINVFDQSALVIVHIHTGSDVHCRHQDHAFAHAAVADNLLYLRRHVHVRPMRFGVEL